MPLNPKLSICIPSYNRARWLPDAFASLLPQMSDSVEVVVSDNASTDNTAQVVREWQSRLPSLSYSATEQNLGADRNYLRSVACATGEYCWLHGSDDTLAPHALATLLPHLARRPAVIVTDRTMMSFDLSRSLGDERMASAANGAEFGGPAARPIEDYFNSVCCFAGVFPFLTNLIVHRESWLAQPSMDEFVGTAWVHVAKIFSMLKAGGSLIYVGRPLVRFRSGNDSFLASLGRCRRVTIDLGYLRLVDQFFGDQPKIHGALTETLHRHVFHWIGLLAARRHTHYDDPQHAAQLDREVQQILAGRVALWPRWLAWRWTPLMLLDWLYQHKETIRRIHGPVGT